MVKVQSLAKEKVVKVQSLAKEKVVKVQSLAKVLKVMVKVGKVRSLVKAQTA